MYKCMYIHVAGKTAALPAAIIHRVCFTFLSFSLKLYTSSFQHRRSCELIKGGYFFNAVPLLIIPVILNVTSYLDTKIFKNLLV